MREGSPDGTTGSKQLKKVQMPREPSRGNLHVSAQQSPPGKQRGGSMIQWEKKPSGVSREEGERAIECMQGPGCFMGVKLAIYRGTWNLWCL